MKLRIATLAPLVLLVAGLAAQTHSKGTWTADIQSNDPSRIHVQFEQGRSNNSGSDFAISDFKGITPAQFSGAQSQVSFELTREEGTIKMRGLVGNDRGYGDYEFTANPDYLAYMRSQGYKNAEREAFALCVIDVSRAYDKEIRDLGFHPSLDQLVAARIFKVGRGQIDGLKSVGISGLSLEKLTEFRIFDVSPEYVKQMRAWQGNISNERLVEFRIHKVTPEFARLMAENGYPNLTTDQLVAFRIHGVDPEFVKQMRSLGFTDLSADKLTEFKIFNVNKEQIDELAKEGYTGLSADKLVEFRIHGIDSAFIERVKKAGYAHPTPDQLVEFKIMGIRMAKNDM